MGGEGAVERLAFDVEILGAPAGMLQPQAEGKPCRPALR
jgi:hypothetical protein